MQEGDLKRLHEGALKSDPFISKAIGPTAKIERMRAAALRLGSQGVPKSYDDHLIIVGDAAGHIDPLTGEGIHTAIMVGSPYAAGLCEFLSAPGFRADFTGIYSLLLLCCCTDVSEALAQS